MTALGFYDKAFSLVNKVFLKMTVVGPGVSFRIFSIIQDEPERFRLAYHKVVMTTTLMTYCAFATVAIMAPHLIVVVLGARWSPAIVPCQVLCVSFALKAMNQYSVTAANARGWVWPTVFRQIIGVLCIAGGVYYAAPRWGIDGAAFAVWVDRLLPLFDPRYHAGGNRTRLGGYVEAPGPRDRSRDLGGEHVVGDRLILAPRAGSLVILCVQSAAAALIALGFAVWCPFREARVLLHDAVNDYFPRLAARLWRDVAVSQEANKQRRRAVKKAAAEAQANLPS